MVRSTTGHTFGGYVLHSIPPAAASGFVRAVPAAGSFLFLLENPHGDPPTLFEYSNNGQAFHSNALCGPIFGYNRTHDILITNDGTSSHTDFPSAYTDTLGRGKATFTGSRVFNVEDYEVWIATP